MKKLLALTLCFGLVAPLAADAQGRGRENREPKEQEQVAEGEEQPEQRARGRGRGRGPRTAEQQQQQQQAQQAQQQQAQQAQQQAQPQQVQDRRNAAIERMIAPSTRAQVQQQQQAQGDAAVDTRRTLPAVQREGLRPQVNTEVNTQQRRSARGDWRQRRGPANQSWTYSEARRHLGRHGTRDRSWWRSNYNRFALFGGGYYYWDRGYWYPAYGYDPRYSTYTYDEPIYGYNQMEPGRVLRNVQIELRRMGYYRGAIDGLIGPMTRSALTRFQRDNGLPVTRRIDGPTLAALGLV